MAATIEGQFFAVIEETRRRAEFEEALAKYLEITTDGIEPRVRGWGKWLDLDETQESLLRDLIRDRDHQELKYFQAWESGVANGELDGMRESFEGAFIRAIRGILSATQEDVLNRKFGEASTK